MQDEAVSCFVLWYPTVRDESLAGREQVEYPDFTLTKPLPRQPSTPRVHCNIGVIEIKTRSNPQEQHVERGNLSVDDALIQAIGYARRLSTSRYENKILVSLLPMWFMAGTTRELPSQTKETHSFLK